MSVLKKGTQGWIRTASTRRTVRRVKKPLRGFFRCAARAIHPRPPRTPVSNGYRSFCFISLEKGTQGWIRTAAALSQKTAQKQPSATATTAACGRNREELLGLRPAGCACRPRHDAAAGSRDPGSLFCAARAMHPRPPKNRNVSKYAAVLFYDAMLCLAVFASPARQSSCARILF